MKKSKVCFFINQLDNSGGTERVTTVVANALSNIGYEVSVLTIQPVEKPFFELDTQVSHNSLNIDNSGMSLIKRFKIITALRKYIVSNDVEILISVDSLLCIYSIPATITTSVKNICWEHFNFNIDLGVKMRRFARHLAGLFVSDIIVLSERDKKFWIENLLFKKAKLSVVYNPTAFPITTKKYNINSNYVLGVGRLCHQKGFDLLLPAWQKVTERYPDWLLVIAGDGNSKNELQQLAQNLNISDKVMLIGAVSEPAELFEEAAIFCFPSRFEGFGLALAEAQAFGIPSIAFDCDCGPSEIIDENCGILIPDFNVETLSKALTELIGNNTRRAEMSKHAIQKAQKFALNSVVLKWTSILSDKDC